VPKARILEAVREGRDEGSAQLIDHLKKGEMAKEAERLLDGTGWLPEPLRPADVSADHSGDGDGDDSADLPEFLAGDDDEDEAGEADEELLAAE
jgi:ParB family chromosome partitioning protein